MQFVEYEQIQLTAVVLIISWLWLVTFSYS